MSGESSQDPIWAYFQNEAPHVFGGAHSHPRLEFILRSVQRLTRLPAPSLLNIGVGDGHLETTAAVLYREILDDNLAVCALPDRGHHGSKTASALRSVPRCIRGPRPTCSNPS